MPEVQDRHGEICADFDTLVAHGVAVSKALAGRVASCEGQRYADPIFSKLVCHAVTLRQITPAGITPTTPDTTEVWDLSSACAISRALIETYDALAYLALQDVDDSERGFRILVWELNDQERRQKVLGLLGSSAPGLTEISENVVRLRGKLMAHKNFASASSNFVGKIQKQDTPPFHLSHAERNQRSEINQDYYNTAVMHLSFYVHTSPFSVHQLMHFRAGEVESLRQMSLPIRYATGFLAKAIRGMETVFGEVVPRPSELTLPVLEKWTSIVKHGICNAGKPGYRAESR